jgi:hypothetical protein
MDETAMLNEMNFENLVECKFKAVNFRVLKRTSWNKYYEALDIKQNYVNNLKKLLTTNK